MTTMDEMYEQVQRSELHQIATARRVGPRGGKVPKQITGAVQ